MKIAIAEEEVEGEEVIQVESGKIGEEKREKIDKEEFKKVDDYGDENVRTRVNKDKKDNVDIHKETVDEENEEEDILSTEILNNY